jgi:hypothetical protein
MPDYNEDFRVSRDRWFPVFPLCAADLLPFRLCLAAPSPYECVFKDCKLHVMVEFGPEGGPSAIHGRRVRLPLCYDTTAVAAERTLHVWYPMSTTPGPLLATGPLVKALETLQKYPLAKLENIV